MQKKNWLKDFLKGMTLGTGVLPGVSVGTVGIIVKIYNKLIDSINGLKHNFKKSFLALLPIALGCVLSAVVLLAVQDTTYSYIPFEITCLFAGFVLAGVPVLLIDLKEKKWFLQDFLKILVGIIIAAGIGILSVVAKLYWGLDFSYAFENPDGNWWIYLVTAIVGFVAAVGCLLPGISGAMILFIFGLYNPVIALYKGDNSIFHNSSRIGSGILLTIVLLIGAIIGLFAISKVMGNLLEKHKENTYLLVIGFIFGSLVSMFINQQLWSIYPSLSLTHIIIGIAIFLISSISFWILIYKVLKR